MQLTAITAILAAALSASASPLDARAAPSIIGHFYGANDQGCNANDLHFQFEFEQDNSAKPACRNLVVPANIKIEATNFTNNTLTRKMRFYEAANCPETGGFRFLTLAPKGAPPSDGPQDGCKSQKILSYKTIL